MSDLLNAANNRVIRAINRVTARVAELGYSEEVKETKRKQLDMTLGEYVEFQNRKSLAQVMGRLSFEEATTVYGYLGESLDTFNDQSYEVKLALTMLYANLMGINLQKAG